MSDSLELLTGSNNLSAGSVGLTAQVLSTSGLSSTTLLGLPNYRQQASSFSSGANSDSSLELLDDENAFDRSIRGVEHYYPNSIFPNFSRSYVDTRVGGNTSQDILGDSENYNFTDSSIASTVDPLTGQTIGDSLTGSSTIDALIVSGTLRADNFTFESDFDLTVFSGNGNVDFGSGKKDLLDLSSIFSDTVDLDLANLTGGGVIFDPGNGDRVFDAITLDDGSQILFEGIDSIDFADVTIDLSVTPNDPLFNEQWNLHMMGVHNAWAFTTGSTDVLIGVQDSGLGVNGNGAIHNDLGRTTAYRNNYSDDFLDDIFSHGTAVQGIIAANSNNGIGMSGINWNSSVFHIDVLDGDSKDRDLVEATQNMIDRANRNDQRLVINMSLGLFGGNYPELEQLIANNLDNALFVIASGNEDASSISYPSSLAQKYSNVIAVGASWGTHDADNNETDPGTRISYPGWWGSNYGDGLTLMAPSEVIATGAMKTSSDTVEFDYKAAFNGTSAATPNVAGVASLVWSANSNLTASQVKEIMSQTAYDLGTPGYDTTYGHGFVNADAAVRRAIATQFS